MSIWKLRCQKCGRCIKHPLTLGLLKLCFKCKIRIVRLRRGGKRSTRIVKETAWS